MCRFLQRLGLGIRLGIVEGSASVLARAQRSVDSVSARCVFQFHDVAYFEKLLRHAPLGPQIERGTFRQMGLG